MADDDVRPGAPPDPSPPGRDRAHGSVVLDATAAETAPTADKPLPDHPAGDATDPMPVGETAPPPEHGETMEGEVTAHAAEPPASEPPAAVGEPSMAAAAADLASPDRPAESFAASPEAPAARRSILPMLLATIGVVLIVLLGINLYLMANPPGDAGLSALTTKVDGLDQRVAAVEAKGSPTALDGRVAALEGQIKQLAVPAGPATDGAVTAIGGRIDALDQEVSDLRQQVATLPKPDTGPIEAKIAEVATGLAAAKAESATGVAAVRAEVAALPKIDLAPLDAKVAAIDQRLAPIETEFSAPKIAAHVSEARQNGSAAETRAAPLAVTAQAVLQALDEGKPFVPELAALQALGADEAKLAVLRPVAQKGAATKAALLGGFGTARDAIVVAAAPVQTGTMFDRMMASAQSVVKVRAAGASPGGDTDAIASRIDADIAAGAFAAALSEWNGLPDAAKTASSAWAEQLKARALAETAARSIASGAIAALGAMP